MADKSAERVMVVPTSLFHELGLFQGFSPRVDHYLPALLESGQVSYRLRSEAETDPTFKQIIPYVILRCAGQLFHYLRGKRSTEARLHAQRSLGIGGHISASDATLFDSPYREGLLREVAEEIVVASTYEERCIGVINDDSMPVGRVHLGIVHVFDLAEPRVQPRESGLLQAGFSPLAELRGRRDEFETWSRFLLEADVLD